MKILSVKYNLYFIGLLIALTLIVSCKQDDILVKSIDESGYDVSNESLAYLAGIDGKVNSSSIDLRGEGSFDLQLQVTKTNAKGISGQLTYNEALLDTYNQKNGTTFRLFPENLVRFTNEGKLVIAKEAVVSNKVSVTMKTSDAIDDKEVYVIPLSATQLNGAVLAKSSDLLLFVQDMSNVPSTDKSTGIKIISCMEVNDTNPLNNLSLKLKNSDKYLVDMVILFSSNINYDVSTGKVKVTHNPNVTHLLANSDKYIKPLQDKGIKVLLSLLGNHDRSGVANLSDEAARVFAREIKAVCDAYNLDGVFFDDEYSAYQNPPPPGFVTPSFKAAARLVYETKQAMPDKLTMVYVYGRTSNFGGNNAITEAKAGEYVDYALHDYRQAYDLTSRYPELPKTRWGMSSGEYALNRYPSLSDLQSLRDGGYGAHMIFAVDPNRANFNSRQIPELKKIATTLFDDELVVDQNHIYSKDW